MVTPRGARHEAFAWPAADSWSPDLSQPAAGLDWTGLCCACATYSSGSSAISNISGAAREHELGVGGIVWLVTCCSASSSSIASSVSEFLLSQLNSDTHGVSTEIAWSCKVFQAGPCPLPQEPLFPGNEISTPPHHMQMSVFVTVPFQEKRKAGQSSTVLCL